MVSSMLDLAGPMQASRAVRLLPMRASLRRSVSLDSRNGGSALPPFVARSEITRDKVDRDWLMPIPSFSLAPVACVFFCRSLPAKSTKWILAWLSTVLPAEVLMDVRICSVKMAWEREDTSFICVAPTARLLAP